MSETYEIFGAELQFIARAKQYGGTRIRDLIN
jgi:hypothetical protein